MVNGLGPVYDMDELHQLLVVQMLSQMVSVVCLTLLRHLYHQISVCHDLQVLLPLPHELINEHVTALMDEYDQVSVLHHVLDLHVI